MLSARWFLRLPRASAGLDHCALGPRSPPGHRVTQGHTGPQGLARYKRMVAGTTQGPVVSTYRRAPGVARHDDRRGVAVTPLHLAAG